MKHNHSKRHCPHLIVSYIQIQQEHQLQKKGLQWLIWISWASKSYALIKQDKKQNPTKHNKSKYFLITSGDNSFFWSIRKDKNLLDPFRIFIMLAAAPRTTRRKSLFRPTCLAYFYIVYANAKSEFIKRIKWGKPHIVYYC